MDFDNLTKLKLTREMFRLIPRPIRNVLISSAKSPYPETMYEKYPSYGMLLNLLDGETKNEFLSWIQKNEDSIVKTFKLPEKVKKSEEIYSNFKFSKIEESENESISE